MLLLQLVFCYLSSVNLKLKEFFMNILKQFKIIVITSILFAQTPQLCNAEYTLQEISQEFGKKMIIGTCAFVSGLFIYQGSKQFFFPPILCKKRTIQAKLDKNATISERANKPTTIEHIFEYNDMTNNQQKKCFLFAAIGTVRLTASWFANKYS